MSEHMYSVGDEFELDAVPLNIKVTIKSISQFVEINKRGDVVPSYEAEISLLKTNIEIDEEMIDEYQHRNYRSK